MNKKKTKIIVILLVIVMLGSTLGYSISSIINTTNQNNTEKVQEEAEQTLSYSEKLQEVLNQAVNDKNLIKEGVLNDLIKRNEASDYSLSTTINILGTPICVLESYEGYTVNVYSDKDEITKLLNNISKNENYTSDSFIQLYWMKETGEAIITWIALGEEDMSEVKTVGIITSQYQDLDNMKLETTNITVDTISSLKLNKKSLIEKYNPTLYKVQNKLLECNFIKNLMEADEYKYTWNEYVLKNKYGYLFLNTKDEEFYLAYQDFSDVTQIPIYNEDTLNKLEDGMTLDEFLKVVPNAMFYEYYFYNNESVYTSYVIRTSEEDENLTYYDFKDGILSLEKENEVTETPIPTDTISDNNIN